MRSGVISLPRIHGGERWFIKTRHLKAMRGSTVINHQQHVGLQKLSALAGITHSSLGPNKKYKFIQDDTSGESALVCSCFRIFENLDLTSAVGQLVLETIQAHERVYRTGSGCLLFLAGAWSRAALECLQRGISAAHIIPAMSEGMDICLNVCTKCSVPIEALGVEQSETYSTTAHGFRLELLKKTVVEASQASCHQRGTTKVHKSLNAGGQRKIKLSRHFCEPENVSTAVQHHQPQVPDIAQVAEGLSHGCDDMMSLVVEASRIQSGNNQPDIGCSVFDVAEVLTCVLPGLPEEHACVLPGCVVVLTAEQASVANNLKKRPLKLALINGDLSESFRHLGFKRPTGIQRVTDLRGVSSSSKEDEWVERFLTLLLKLEVNLILTSGLVTERVIHCCCRYDILVVGKIKVSVLKAFADATGAVPVTYTTQLNTHCVGAGVNVVTRRDLGSHERNPSATVNISIVGNSKLVTVVLTSCVQGKLQALEDRFWACAYRLHHALKDKVLLPGAGVTEMMCVHHLQKQAEHYGKQHRERMETSVQEAKAGAVANPYRGVVLQLMADGFIDYISTVMVNTGGFSKARARTAVSQQLQDYNESQDIAAQFSQLFLASKEEDTAAASPGPSLLKSSEAPAVKIYDSLSVKQEAWRKALDLVLLVLQTDAEVITGTDQRTESVQENLMLL